MASIATTCLFLIILLPGNIDANAIQVPQELIEVAEVLMRQVNSNEREILDPVTVRDKMLKLADWTADQYIRSRLIAIMSRVKQLFYDEPTAFSAIMAKLLPYLGDFDCKQAASLVSWHTQRQCDVEWDPPLDMALLLERSECFDEWVFTENVALFILQRKGITQAATDFDRLALMKKFEPPITGVLTYLNCLHKKRSLSDQEYEIVLKWARENWSIVATQNVKKDTLLGPIWLALAAMENRITDQKALDAFVSELEAWNSDEVTDENRALMRTFIAEIHRNAMKKLLHDAK